MALRAGTRAVEHLFRRAGDRSPTRRGAVPLPAAAVLLDRALRFLLLVGGLGLLAWGWGIDYGALPTRTTRWPGSRAGRCTP